MTFVWARELERNRVALLGVLASLLSMAGLLADGTLAPRNIGHDTMPRRFYLRILQLIKPAESALRRLVVTMARAIKVTVKVRKARPACTETPAEGRPPSHLVGVRSGPRSGPIDNDLSIGATNARSHSGGPDRVRGGGQIEDSLPPPAHSASPYSRPPLKGEVVIGWNPTENLSTLAPMTLTLSVPRPSRRRSPAALAATPMPPRTNAPRIPPFPLFDPCIRFDRRTWIQAEDFAAYLAARKPQPVRGPLFLYEEVDSSKIIARVLAFKAALDDIPAQALRLARLQARRRANEHARHRRTEPLRRSTPPGWLRHRRRYPRFSEEERILRDCNALALWAEAKNPDTS